MSALAHVIIFLLLMSGIPNPIDFYTDRAIDLDLMRIPAAPPPPEPELKPKPAQAAASPAPKPKVVARPTPSPLPPPVRSTPGPPQQTPLPPAPPAPNAGAGRGQGQGQGNPAARQPAPPEEAGRGNCIVKNLDKMDPKERLACETHVFAFMDKQLKIEAPQDPALDPAKKAEYDAALARKHYKSAPVSGLGNGSQAGCKQANLGMGCPGETELPVFKSSQ